MTVFILLIVMLVAMLIAILANAAMHGKKNINVNPEPPKQPDLSKIKSPPKVL